MTLNEEVKGYIIEYSERHNAFGLDTSSNDISFGGLIQVDPDV